jgi:hypothetical protein
VRWLNAFSSLMLVVVLQCSVLAATYSTPNFIVTAADPAIAKEAGDIAELKRDALSLLWFDALPPRWAEKCPISVEINNTSGSGATSFAFDNGEVIGWQMQVKGTREAVMKDVIQHEVNHTLFASYFRRPLPRWADEGAASVVETDTSHERMQQYLTQIHKSRWFIPLPALLDIRDYPKEPEYVGALYSEGYSLTSFLLAQKDHETFVKFLGLQPRVGWEKAVEVHYGIPNLGELHNEWCRWVEAGCAKSPIEMVSNRGPHGEKATIVFFVTSTCTNCEPIKRAERDNKFADYNVAFVYLDGPNGEPFCDVNGNGRPDGRETMFARQYIAQFKHETGKNLHEMRLVPILWIPLTAKYIIGATEVVEIVRWVGSVVRRFVNIIFGGRPAIGNDPDPMAAVNVKPKTYPSTSEPALGDPSPTSPFVPSTEPDEPPAEPKPDEIDWSDVNIIMLIDASDHKLASKLLPLARGMIHRKIKELTDGKAELVIIDSESNPTGYAAVVKAANAVPDPICVLAMIKRQPLGLKALIAGRIEEKIKNEHLSHLKGTVEVIFERNDPKEYAGIIAATEAQPNPRNGDFSIYAIVAAVLGGLGLGSLKDLAWKWLVGRSKAAAVAAITPAAPAAPTPVPTTPPQATATVQAPAARPAPQAPKQAT